MKKIVKAFLLTCFVQSVFCADFQDRLGIKKNMTKIPVFCSMTHLNTIAGEGEPFAQSVLAKCYLWGVCVEKNLAKAAEWFEKAANQDSDKCKNVAETQYYVTESQYNLGVCYENGVGLIRNPKLARSSFESSANGGFPKAQYRLGADLYDGNGVDKNIEKAMEWWKKAADGGDPNAQNKLGAICYQGKHGKKDVTVGIDLLQRSAEQGHPEALFNLAICYNKGEGIERNFPKTDQLLAIAHEKGHPTAAMYRVVLYLTKDDF